jgi:hypothetical protein
MNEAATVALCESNMEHWPGVQVTGSPADFSLLQEDATDHWEYSLKLFSCSGVTPSWFMSASSPVERKRWPNLPCLLQLGAPRAREAKDRQVRRGPFMVGGPGVGGYTYDRGRMYWTQHGYPQGTRSRATDHTCTYKTTPAPGCTVASPVFIPPLSCHGETRRS